MRLWLKKNKEFSAHVLGKMGKVYPILFAFLETNDGTVTELQAQAQPGAFNGDIMNTPYVYVSWRLETVDIGVKSITSMDKYKASL